MDYNIESITKRGFEPITVGARGRETEEGTAERAAGQWTHFFLLM